LGGFILPFYIYPEIQNNMWLNRENLFIGIIGEILCLLTFLILSCKTNVLTNYRLLNQWSFDFLNVLGKDPTNASALFINTDLKYADILTIKNRKDLWVDFVDIKTKDGKYLYLRSINDIKKIKNIIEKQIEITK